MPYNPLFRRLSIWRPVDKNITKLYLLNIVTNAQFHLVVYTLFLLSKGFSTQQFFVIESAYYLIALIMEIPTGVFSDRISRKWSLVAASIVGVPVIPAIVFSDSFIVVLTAMSVGGISSALVSGTDIAILYDTVQALGREHEFKVIVGRMRWHASLSMAVSGMLGGLVAQMNMAYAWWAYFFAGLVALPIKLTLQEPPISRPLDRRESYLQHLGQSLRLSFRGDAAYFVFYAAIIWLFFSLGFWLWQPYLKLIGVPVAAFGFIYAGLNLVSGYASKQVHILEKRLGMRNSLLVIPLLLAGAFLLESQVVFRIAFCFIALQAIASGFFSPLLEDYINKRIPSSRRATILSVKNMVNGLVFMLVSPLIGHIVDLYSLTTALLLMSVCVCILGFAFFGAFRTQPGAAHQIAR